MTRTTPRRLMTLHRSHIGFTLALTFTTLSLCPEPVSDPSPAQVVGAQLHLHPVARQYPDVVHPHLARDVSEHVVSALELEPKMRVGQRLGDGAFNLYNVFFGQGPPISDGYKMAGAKRISYHAGPGAHTFTVHSHRRSGSAPTGPRRLRRWCARSGRRGSRPRCRWTSRPTR